MISTVRTICNRNADQIKEFTKNITPSQSKQNAKVRSHLENITAGKCILFQACEGIRSEERNIFNVLYTFT